MAPVPRLILSRGAPELGVPIVRLDNRPTAKHKLPYAVVYFYDASFWCWSHWHPGLKRSLGCHLQDPNDETGDPNKCPHCSRTAREKSHYAPVAIARPASDCGFSTDKLPNMGSLSRAILGIPQTSAVVFEAPELAGRTVFARWFSPKRVAIEFQWDLSPRNLPAPFDFTSELQRHLFLNIPDGTEQPQRETLRFDTMTGSKGGAS